jgi:hypothetical protein
MAQNPGDGEWINPEDGQIEGLRGSGIPNRKRNINLTIIYKMNF